MGLCLFSGRQFEDTFENTLCKKSQINANATNVPLPFFEQTIWGDIWKLTVEKSQTNAANVTLPFFRADNLTKHLKAHSGEKSKKCNLRTHLKTHCVEKSNKCNQCDFAFFDQTILGDIWKHTVEKSLTNVTNVTFPPLGQAIWGCIWKHSWLWLFCADKRSKRLIFG